MATVTSTNSYQYTSTSSAYGSNNSNQNNSPNPPSSSTTSNGDEDMFCSKCNESIKSGKALKAGNKVWHDHHFVCSICGLPLKDEKVYQKDGKLYCDGDYKKRFVPRCAFCSGYISQDCVKALDQSWHPTCFLCRKCNKAFGKDEGFHEMNGTPYCKTCYIDTACDKCAGCSRPITDKAMKALDQTWHVGCFVCKECGKSFEGQQSFYCVDGRPCCGNCVDAS
ncbi:hypothetical protein TCAL_01994 [Tigriopus californicus]|uniref:LIM zinc-binding domain-containing protein n=1 Tax=Tigriopus californicus TaxID=6832 RepID=A0A553PNF2_TIGCA|nr:leupaxin-like [Tigriopus californicus]XP_059084733.1 leupaxin-like [Tigriopus californicus]TRY79206.1 hypothetical protein TCAL_01994 [Tigriopus californicus]|eukprot:TCALIF_01994-PA protein Name:"Similar to TGFB1I1 Transforming growth factor beta-1-induced transcript 1 protein (Homo sapiens)" AED:0.11 eAED:0.11 QI:161/1/1/1/0.75/0.6/5/325/222